MPPKELSQIRFVACVLLCTRCCGSYLPFVLMPSCIHIKRS